MLAEACRLNRLTRLGDREANFVMTFEGCFEVCFRNERVWISNEVIRENLQKLLGANIRKRNSWTMT